MLPARKMPPRVARRLARLVERQRRKQAQRARSAPVVADPIEVPEPVKAPEPLRPVEADPELTDRVLASLLGPAHAPNTVAAYRSDLRQFALWLGTTMEVASARLLGNDGQQQAQAWLEATSATTMTATRQRRAQTLKTLAATARSLGLDVQLDPIPPKCEDPVPAREEIDKLIEAAKEPRERALVLLLASVDGDVRSLRADDYDHEGRRVKFDGKDWINVLEEPALALEAWLDLDKPTGAIFHAAGRAEPLTQAGLRFILDKLCERAGVKLCPDDLRRFAARSVG